MNGFMKFLRSVKKQMLNFSLNNGAELIKRKLAEYLMAEPTMICLRLRSLLMSSHNLPSHWSWVKLGDICEIIMGQSPPSSTYNTDGIGLPFFQGKAEFTELYPEVRKWCS